MEKQETNVERAVKRNIVTFVSFGILIGFLFALLTTFIYSRLLPSSNIGLSITLSLICGIILYYLVKFVNSASIVSTLRRFTLNDIDKRVFVKKMNLFFLVCIVISILGSLSYLVVDNFTYVNAMEQTYMKYDGELANRIITQICSKYKSTLSSKVIFATVIEISLVVSFFSLIGIQRKKLL